MSSYEIASEASVSPIEFIEQAPWSGSSSHVIDVLGLAGTSSVLVHEGEAESVPLDLIPGQPHILAANGISKCMAILFPAGASGKRDALAHTTKEQFGGTLSPHTRCGEDIILIKHASQTITPAFEQSSALNVARRTIVRVQAGQERMGVAWDTSTGIISVVRRDPDRSVLRFRLTSSPVTAD